MSATGKIHSIETCGTLDGPGLRFVIFLQGCSLRCKFCHNPDSWDPGGGTERGVEELLDEAERYRSYLDAARGGITVTGGEPLLQADFVAELFARAHERGLHTALDTSGYAPTAKATRVLAHTDLVLFSLKAFHRTAFKRVAGGSVEVSLAFAELLARLKKPTWLRYVLVPGLTDAPEEIAALGEYMASLGIVERVELLPFHKMGEFKWRELGYPYSLANTRIPTAEEESRAELLLGSLIGSKTKKMPSHLGEGITAPGSLSWS